MNTFVASKVRNAFAFATLAIGLSASAAFAQDRVLTANVPFAFESGSQHFAPGSYRIALPSDHMLELQNSTTRTTKLIMTNPEIRVSSTKPGKLVFKKYGDRYFLRQVWGPNDGTGRSLAKSKAEKEVQIASTQQPQPDVTLALNSLPR